MENWIFLLLGLILAYLLEFTRPWVKSYFEKSSLSWRDRRIFIIRSRYQHVKKLRNDPAYMSRFAHKNMAIGLLFLFMVIIIGIITVVRRISEMPLDIISWQSRMDAAMMLFSMILGIYLMAQIALNINDADSFDKYRSKIITRLVKLGGNPEDLDKEEIA